MDITLKVYCDDSVTLDKGVFATVGSREEGIQLMKSWMREADELGYENCFSARKGHFICLYNRDGYAFHLES